jgi:hypothetical protein
MLINGRVNQRRDNSTNNLVCMSKEISSSNQDWAREDISMSLEKTLSSRPEMDSRANNGTSTKDH